MDQNESQKKNQEYCKRESELFNIDPFIMLYLLEHGFDGSPSFL